MAEEKIKINMADEGGWFNWADEVEEEIPLGARVPPGHLLAGPQLRW